MMLPEMVEVGDHFTRLHMPEGGYPAAHLDLSALVEPKHGITLKLLREYGTDLVQ